MLYFVVKETSYFAVLWSRRHAAILHGDYNLMKVRLTEYTRHTIFLHRYKHNSGTFAAHQEYSIYHGVSYHVLPVLLTYFLARQFEVILAL